MADKLNMQTSNGVAENIKWIAKRFPNCIVEVQDSLTGKAKKTLDFDILRQELSDEVVEGRDERYQFVWPDKKKAILLANSPINATLRPCREESVDFDRTQNLYIEGDNLDVLKCLKETYLGRVKMIYIDPPYNTGHDFVYEDDFAQSAEQYANNSGQYDDYGNKLTENLESNGRFHTDWLNMIYPRLKVSRDLLNDQGMIFISIDQNEITNLTKICDELYGADNKLGIISNTNNPKGRSDDKFIATAHEYILVYAKNKASVDWYGFEPTDEIIKRYNKIDSEGKKYREIDLRKTGENDLREDRPNLFYYFYYNESTGEFYPSRSSDSIPGFIQIKPQREDGMEGNWRWGLDTAIKQIGDLVPKFMPSRKVWGVMQKDYLEGRSLVKPTSSWTFKDVNSERGTEEFIGLGFDKRVFPKPKPIGTILRCIKLASYKSSDDIILDFFSGSATTAHAVMQMNISDLGNRKFIMVQIPEPTDKTSFANKEGYNTICEIGKERIRRAGKSVIESSLLNADNVDCGFRVLKLDSSNMLDVYYAPAELQQDQMFGFVDNVKNLRTSEDLLFQVMLELGATLDSKIECCKIAGKEIFNVADGYLVACFDKEVNDTVVQEIAKMEPQYAVLRDNSLANDSTATNFEQIFKTYSPSTTCKIL
jgi:adenine-specific DNA-methyltransferase